MLSPDFLEHLEWGGVRPPHCTGCAHAAHFERELVCLEFGAWVLLNSSCKSFQRKEKGLPVVRKEDVEGKSGSRLVDLRRTAFEVS
jgi:hypothetical protein